MTKVVLMSKVPKKYSIITRKRFKCALLSEPQLYFFLKERQFLVKLNNLFVRDCDRHYPKTLVHQPQQLNNCVPLKLGNIYLLYNRWSHNFHHFFMDVMIGLDVGLIKEQNLQVVFPVKYCKKEIPTCIITAFRDMMTILNINNYLILEQPQDLCLCCHQLYLNIQPDKKNFVSQLLRSSISNQTSKYLYIERESSDYTFDEQLPFENYYQNRDQYPRRFLINSGVLKQQLSSKFNFEKIKTEQMSFSDRLSYLQSAQIIIVEAGASLDNLYFCNPKAIKIILCPKSSNYHQALVKHSMSWSPHIYFGEYIYNFKKKQLPIAHFDYYGISPWKLPESVIDNLIIFVEQQIVSESLQS